LGIINVIAILLSPIIAVLVSIWVTKFREKRQQQFILFSTLMSTRHTPIRDEQVRALNLIDVLFSKNKKVRKLWHEYFDMLGNKGLDNELGWEQRGKKNIELIHEMGTSLGFGKAISQMDVDRVYIPVGLAQQGKMQEELIKGFIRFLTTRSTQTEPLDEDKKEE